MTHCYLEELNDIKCMYFTVFYCPVLVARTGATPEALKISCGWIAWAPVFVRR